MFCNACYDELTKAEAACPCCETTLSTRIRNRILEKVRDKHFWTSGNEHIGALVGMRFGKRMYLGQVIARTPARHSASREDQGVDLYKILFHDNDVYDFNLTELIQGKEDLTSDLQTVKNVAALRRCVERWYMNKVDIADGGGESSRSRARKRRV